ncbi:unnamed protein product [Pieris macdunnoughi]|uniref:Uncharacterized protein n=1 Tax=Pieris macdunnoughi TaxID=345717 RepID=A0A821NNF5_9NEOP|nr:unnamed protein product [Pieris macdunnoughi]
MVARGLVLLPSRERTWRPPRYECDPRPPRAARLTRCGATCVAVPCACYGLLPQQPSSAYNDIASYHSCSFRNPPCPRLALAKKFM